MSTLLSVNYNFMWAFSVCTTLSQKFSQTPCSWSRNTITSIWSSAVTTMLPQTFACPESFIRCAHEVDKIWKFRFVNLISLASNIWVDFFKGRSFDHTYPGALEITSGTQFGARPSLISSSYATAEGTAAFGCYADL